MKQEQSIKREQITRKNFKKRKICQPKGEAQWVWKTESKKSLLRKEMMKEKYIRVSIYNIEQPINRTDKKRKKKWLSKKFSNK